MVLAVLLLSPGYGVQAGAGRGAAGSPNTAHDPKLPPHFSPKNHFVIAKHAVREQMDPRDYFYLEHIDQSWNDTAQRGDRPFVTDIMSGEDQAYPTWQKYQHPQGAHFDVLDVQETLEGGELRVTLSCRTTWPEKVTGSHGNENQTLGPFDVNGEGLDGARSDAVNAIIDVLKGWDAVHRGQQVAGLQGGQ